MTEGHERPSLKLSFSKITELLAKLRRKTLDVISFDPPLPEIPGYIRAFSGLSEKQFCHGAIVDEKGLTWFDKLKLADKYDDEIYYAFDLATAMNYAFNRAGIYGDPLVISGLLNRSGLSGIKLNPGDMFPVDTLWFPGEGHPQDIWCHLGDKGKSPEQNLCRLNPAEFLKNKRLT